MNKDNIGNDLFLLMLNLSQLSNTIRVKQVFIEAVSSLFPKYSLAYCEEDSNSDYVLPISTDRNNFGYLAFEVKEAEPINELAFVRNAVSMLAVILENHLQRSLLSDEKILLEAAVQERTEELTRINEELQSEIEERIQAEEQIFFQASLLDKVHNAIIVTDLDLRITYWNDYATELYQWQQDEALGKPVSDITVPVDKNGEMADVMKTMLEEGSWIGEFEVRRKDGSTFVALVSNTIIYDSNGNRTGIIGVSSDITDLHESESKRKMLLTQLQGRLNEMQCLYELSKVVQKPNMSLDAFLMNAVSLIPTAFVDDEDYSVRISVNNDIYTNEHFKESDSIISQRIIVNGEDWGAIEIFSHKNESDPTLLHPLKDYFILITSINDYISRFIERIIFITELQLEKERAEKASQIKMNLLSNMNHEIRTPLSGILGYASYLSEHLREERFKEMASQINVSGQRLLNTLNSVIDLSKLSSESIIKDADKTELDLNLFIRNLVQKHEHNILRKELTLKFTPHNEPVLCKSKAILLEQALDHIIDNAIKYTYKGTISISVSPDEDYTHASILIEDTGIGISETHLNVIFDPFRQVSEGYGRNYEGVGLGLSITKKIAELLGLEINLQSTPEIGSSFTLSIPLTNSENRKRSRQYIMAQNNNDLQQSNNNFSDLPKVLLVEDNAINQDVVSLYLTDICRVECAANAISALQMIKKTQYELILMDINLGVGMNGVDLTKELKKLQNYKDTPVLAVTGYALPEDKEHLLNQGIDYYLAKPFNREQLVTVVQDIFGRS